MGGAKRFVGNPYDGHTLAAQISQSNELIKGAGSEVKQAVVDLGYRAWMPTIPVLRWSDLVPKKRTPRGVLI